MDLMKILANAGGGDGVARMARELGIDAADAGRMVEAVAPALGNGLAKQATSAGSLASLGRALETGGHERYLEDPDLLARQETREDGNRILGHLLGSKEVSRSVAAQAAGRTGLDAGTIKRALPLIASLAMGAMRRETKKAAPETRDGVGLGTLASLLGDGGGSRLGDSVGLARKLF